MHGVTSNDQTAQGEKGGGIQLCRGGEEAQGKMQDTRRKLRRESRDTRETTQEGHRDTGEMREMQER